MALSKNIKNFREIKNMSQKELSEKAGVSQVMISQYESGLKIPTIVTALKMAKALDCTCEELME